MERQQGTTPTSGSVSHTTSPPYGTSSSQRAEFQCSFQCQCQRPSGGSSSGSSSSGWREQAFCPTNTTSYKYSLSTRTRTQHVIATNATGYCGARAVDATNQHWSESAFCSFIIPLNASHVPGCCGVIICNRLDGGI